jgi:hypothetical protein
VPSRVSHCDLRLVGERFGQRGVGDQQRVEDAIGEEDGGSIEEEKQGLDPRALVGQPVRLEVVVGQVVELAGEGGSTPSAPLTPQAPATQWCLARACRSPVVADAARLTEQDGRRHRVVSLGALQELRISPGSRQPSSSTPHGLSPFGEHVSTQVAQLWLDMTSSWCHNGTDGPAAVHRRDP